jgi:hypothetical protein
MPDSIQVYTVRHSSAILPDLTPPNQEALGFWQPVNIIFMIMTVLGLTILISIMYGAYRL